MTTAALGGRGRAVMQRKTLVPTRRTHSRDAAWYHRRCQGLPPLGPPTSNASMPDTLLI